MEATKSCFKCGEVKSLSAFYKHPRMADGHVNKCKECNKSDNAANRLRNIDSVREYDRARGNRLSPEMVQRYRDKNPKKRAAHVKVGNAIRDGVLVPQPCEVCGELQVHAHHTDYDRQLDVMWLCPVHHKAWHKEHSEGANAH
jgi:hypothetical protein